MTRESTRPGDPPVDPSSTAKTRKIIHVDMDCFYAAIEVRDRPELRGRPVAVGGSPDGRGVLTTCTYEARRYGIHSAMPSSRALRLCSELIILPVDMQRYREVSREIQALFHELTARVEPVSLDEAYLDVTECPECGGSATLIARQLRRRIRETQGLSASTGVAPNKFLAKVASDWNKPDGEMVIRPEQVARFVSQLGVNKIPGVGPVTAARLARLGIETCEDLQALDLPTLVREFGRFGRRLHDLSRGIDSRPVHSGHERKSLSVERTFGEDLHDLAAVEAVMPRLFDQLQRRLATARDLDHRHIRALVVKLKFRDFSVTTAQRSAAQPLLELYLHLCREAWMRRALPVRLVGLGIRLTQPAHAEHTSQLALWRAD